MKGRKFYMSSMHDGRYVFSFGNRVVSVHQLDNTARDIEQSIGVEIVLRRGGAYVIGTLDQLERFAAILDVTNTLDGVDAAYRRLSIAEAKGLRAYVADARKAVRS